MEQISIRLIANSGVCVQRGTQRFLVDGIYGKNRFFTQPLKEIQRAVFGMSSPYRDVDYILHTHRHTDHFSAAYVDEYVANNAVKAVFVPQSGPDPNSFLEDRMPLPKAAVRGCLREIRLDRGGSCTYPLEDGARISYYWCRHLDWKSYALVLHCAVLLTLGDKQFLFAADADSTEENFAVFRTAGKLTAVFVTPLFFLHPAGRHMLEALEPERAVLYHIPFAEDDETGLRAMVEQELADYAGPLCLEALTEPEQTLVF